MATHDGKAAESGGLAINRSRREQAVVLAVRGEVDVATGARLRTAIGAGLEDPAVKLVVVDLAAVEFMSSTGIAVLVDAQWDAEQRGKSVRTVVADSGAVLRALHTTGVDRLLAMYPDRESALRGQ